jgi:hypothetical protein
MAEALLHDEAEAVVRALIANAKKGDTAAAAFIVRRLLPVRHPVEFSLPPVTEAADIAAAVTALAKQMSEGKLTIEEAAAAAGVLEVQRRTIETSDTLKRLAALEAAVQEKRK